MADEADIGNEVAERNLDMALQAVKAVKREQSEECVECGDVISAARQQATGGTDICAPCLYVHEQNAKRYRGNGW